MLRLLKHLPLLLICLAVSAQTRTGNVPPKPKVVSTAPDLTRQPTLYVVGYAHLDTEWRWEYPQVIREYLSKTLRTNFDLFEKYPHYIFNFSGANRYRLMKEYYPADYERLKQYVAAGRWFPAGSSMEESDVNSPSAESIFRQVLYGNRYFRRDFGKASAEYMLPDCFGFPASLPSILAHAGIKGFSTQKLTWGSSAPAGGPDSPERTPAGTPFNVGIWEGPDGKTILAGFNPGSYSADITSDLSKPLPPPAEASTGQQDPQQREFQRYQGDWAQRVQQNGKVSGLFTEYHYYGTGDVGGAPRESSIKLLEAIINKNRTVIPAPRRFGQPQQPPAAPSEPVLVGDGPVHVVSANAEQMFLDIKPDQMAKLPRYKGELELTNHSAGSLSSEAYQKRWNRKNELLADAAEKSSVMAQWLGGRPYPAERLNNAWTLVLGGQFHDIMAGTATPQSYNYAWNDDVLAMNQFAGILTSATAAVASGMNTQTQGMPIVVYNPLNVAREDVVEAEVSLPPGTAGQAATKNKLYGAQPPGSPTRAGVARGGVEVPSAATEESSQAEKILHSGTTGVRVSDPDGKEVPAQIAGNKILFLAKVPSVGYAVYDVQAASSAAAPSSELKVSETSLENSRYKITVDPNGDVSSIFDKQINKELLSAPLRLALQTEKPHDWPAWNMDWEDQKKPPRGYVQGAAQVRIVENGPARVALQIERETEGSKFVQTVRLSAGDAGNRVEFVNAIDWKTREAALKATFPLTASNPEATYNWDVGTIQRGNNDEKKFEVPSHQWIDLTDKGGAYGVTVLSDCKYGSDKPDDNTLRLTLIYTPGLGEGNGRAYSDQLTQDLGHHEFIYGLAGHAGDWRQAQSDWQAYRLNQPLIAFESAKHAGTLGKEFSLLKLSNSRVRVLALKKAEEGNDIIVRLVELDGKAAPDVHLAFAAPVISAREVDGQEMPVGPARTANGELLASFTPYQLHTFALKLAPATKKVAEPKSQPLSLAYDASVASLEDRPSQGCFDCFGDEPTSPQGKALPAEMLPTQLEFAGINFNLAPSGKRNAVSAHGQTIQLPAGKFSRLYLLAAAANNDQKATFHIDDKPVELTIQEWTGNIGQWDNRSWTTRQEPIPLRPGAPAPPPGAPPRMRKVMDFDGKITPGFIKRDDVAWWASHIHGSDGNFEAYSYSYLFAYPIDLPPNAKTLTLPDNQRIRILAITAAGEPGTVHPAQPLYDTLRPTP